MKQTLTLIRASPGCGKSTLAKKMIKEDVNAIHVETDMFFMKDGQYLFDPSKIKDAHNWCQKTVKECIEYGFNVIVSNTFTQLWEMEYYIELAKELSIEFKQN